MSIFVALLVAAQGAQPAVALRAALERIQAGELEVACEIITTALVADPEDGELLLAQGRVLRRLGRSAQAVGPLTRLLELDPHADEARHELARALWEAGRPDDAGRLVGELLERHPQHAAALGLRAELVANPVAQPAERSMLAPVLRVGVSAIVDSNLPEVGSATQSGLDKSGSMLDVDVAGGFALRGRQRPLSVLARVTSQTSLDDPRALGAVVPSTAGLIVVGRRSLGPVMGALDLRYTEVFVDSFAQHTLRLVSPTLHATYPLARHALRLLGGVDVRTPFAAPSVTGSRTLRLGARDTWREGPWELVVDGTYRHDARVGRADAPLPLWGAGDPVPAGALVGFDELAGLLFASYRAGVAAHVEGSVEVARRTHEQLEGDVTDVGLHVGGRYELDDGVELFGAYRFGKTTGDDALAFSRHRVSAGVRFWYE